MPAWEKLCSPIAERVSQAWIEGLPEQAREQAGPLLAMMGSMGGMAFGSQLGQGLAQLAGEVLTSTDVGLPLGPAGTAALLPVSIAEFGSGLDLPEDQVRLFLAAREAAHHRLYAGVPWLRDRILALIKDYAQAISVDFSAVEELASSIDPNDPAQHRERAGSGDVRTEDHRRSGGRDGLAGDPAGAGRGLGRHRRRRGGRRPAARRRARCARRCAAAGRPAVRPSRPSRR